MSGGRGLFWAATLTLLLQGCRDDSAERLAHAKARYQAAIAAGAKGSSPELVDVARELGAISPGSKAAGQAHELLAAIERAKALAPAPPLAVNVTPAQVSASAQRLRDELLAVSRECAALAKAIGSSTQAARGQLETQLRACRRRESTADEALAHASDAAHDDRDAR